MREIKLLIRIYEENNLIGIVGDYSNLGIPNETDKTLFLMGLFEHLANRQASKIEPKFKGDLKWKNK